MKFNSVYASLALAGLASGAAVNHEKRALEVVTITDVVWDVVTVTEYDQTTSTVVAEAAAGTPAAVTLTTTQVAQQQAATTAQAASTSAAAVVASPVQASSSTAAAVVNDAGTTVAVIAAPSSAAPTTSSAVAGNVVAAPSTTQQAAAAAAATTAASSSVSTYSGDATYYELGLTACGQTYADTDYVAAISYKLFDQDGTANPNNNPHCGKKITVLRNGKSVDVTIVDRCAGCEGTYDVDLSPVAFNTIASASEGRVGISWNYA